MKKILDIIGGIADSVASVGGAQPLYRMNLDAAAERARQVDLDAMRKAQFGQQQALGGQQLQAGELEIGNAEREQIGQALAGIVGSENPAEAWGVIAQQAGIPPDKTAAIGQALQQNPEMAGQLAQAFGYEPPKQGSLPSAVQNYGMYQKILRTQGPEAAEQFRQFAMPSQTMLTPAQAAQIGISQERLGIAQDTLAWAQDPNNPLNQQRAAAAAKAAGGGEGGSDVAQILNDFGVRLEGKEDPVAELIRNSTSGRLESWASMIPGAFGHATTGQENIGRLETIDNAIVLGLAGGKLGTGVSNADRDFFKEMSGKISDPTIPIEQRLAAWAQLKPRLRGIVQRGRAPVARQGPAPARQVRGGVADPALEAAMRRRGLK